MKVELPMTKEEVERDEDRPDSGGGGGGGRDAEEGLRSCGVVPLISLMRGLMGPLFHSIR